MSNRATYSCTALLGTNKAGVLKPDAEGYYTVVLGALDFYNSAGDFYPYESAKELFSESSSLMRRIKNGACRAEYGHPKLQPGMSQRDFLARILSIHEDKVCAHIKEVILDDKSVKDVNGKPVMAIIGKVKPCGPYGSVLKESLDNPSENVCFSIRSLTKDVYDGIVNKKNLLQIICWDYVNEPGISVANKYQSPALEGINDKTINFSVEQLTDVRERRLKQVGMESAKTVVDDVIKQLVKNNSKVPTYIKW
jgi:hypothetical protein